MPLAQGLWVSRGCCRIRSMPVVGGTMPSVSECLLFSETAFNSADQSPSYNTFIFSSFFDDLFFNLLIFLLPSWCNFLASLLFSSANPRNGGGPQSSIPAVLSLSALSQLLIVLSQWELVIAIVGAFTPQNMKSLQRRVSCLCWRDNS